MAHLHGKFGLRKAGPCALSAPPNMVDSTYAFENWLVARPHGKIHENKCHRRKGEKILHKIQPLETSYSYVWTSENPRKRRHWFLVAVPGSSVFHKFDALNIGICKPKFRCVLFGMTHISLAILTFLAQFLFFAPLGIHWWPIFQRTPRPPYCDILDKTFFLVTYYQVLCPKDVRKELKELLIFFLIFENFLPLDSHYNKKFQRMPRPPKE